MAASVATQHFPGQGVHLGTMLVYLDAGRTGTGAEETIKHTQGVRPSFIMVQVDDESTATAILSTAATKDSIFVTVTNAKTYSVLAFF